jgi:hypothetical protein
MPLRDHFHPPLSEQASWEEVHGQWPAVIVQHLGKVLPERYVAAPRIHLGSQVEVDIATLETGRTPANAAVRQAGNVDDEGRLATNPWEPAAPSLAVETELDDPDEYEVRVYDAVRGRRLVAAIELVSPANKDRPESRRLFVAKCAALLRQGVAVVLVDVVTARNANLYAELLDWVGERDPALGDDPPGVYAVVARWRPHGGARWLETWARRPVAVGRPLPELPLWLADNLAVPLDLEASYEQTCRDLRIA